MKQALSLAMFMLVAVNLQGQSKTEEMIKEWQRAKEYTKEYLDAMPEASFGLKPTKEMRSFAGQFLHLSEANYGLVATATDEKSPVNFGDLEKSNDEKKASVTKTVMDSYDFVINAIRKYPFDKLSGKVKFFDRFEMSREQAINKCFEHQTHHRGQATVYLRLAGVKPPQEKLF